MFGFIQVCRHSSQVASKPAAIGSWESEPDSTRVRRRLGTKARKSSGLSASA